MWEREGGGGGGESFGRRSVGDGGSGGNEEEEDSTLFRLLLFPPLPRAAYWMGEGDEGGRREKEMGSTVGESGGNVRKQVTAMTHTRGFLMRDGSNGGS